MKKLSIVLMIVMIFVCVLSGCGGSSDSDKKSTKTEGEICAELLPDLNDYFASANITTQLDGRCYYNITKYQDGEYDSYISAIKDANKFPIIHYENSSDTGKTFLAYDENKEYYLQIYFSYEKEDITIECHKIETNNNDTEN